MRFSTAGLPIRAEAVAYRYPQNGHGLPLVSLQIAPGELVLLTGPSGCGKSTLARCLTGLIPHLYRGTLEGEVWLGEWDTRETPLWQLAERAGLVFQNPAAQMLGASVEEEALFGLENLGLPREVMAARLEEMLQRFGLEPFRARAPQTLSGGEQQQVALAAIMARRPAALVLDEPLSMLDGTAAAALVAQLAALARSGVTVVVCEHREEYFRAVSGTRTVRLPGRAAEPDAALPACPTERQLAPPRLEVAGLGVTLAGRPILRDLAFSATGGEIIAVVGRNGVGKTTLLRALAGLQKHAGRVTVDGGRPDLGLAFQNANLQLFNATVRDEVLYRVPAPDKARYAWLLEALGLSAYESTSPLLLSEGEKKRVALMTVLMREPHHGILLDEPSLGQDRAHKRWLIRLMRALAEAGQLVLFTTHDLPLAAQADRLLLLGSEGLVADGPPGRLLRDPVPWAQLGLSVPPWALEALG